MALSSYRDHRKLVLMLQTVDTEMSQVRLTGERRAPREQEAALIFSFQSFPFGSNQTCFLLPNLLTTGARVLEGYDMGWLGVPPHLVKIKYYGCPIIHLKEPPLFYLVKAEARVSFPSYCHEVTWSLLPCSAYEHVDV